MKQETMLATINNVKTTRTRSAWAAGVKTYALMLCETLAENYEDVETYAELKRALLNGAGNWQEYSTGGCALIYDGDIAKTLCSPSELAKTDGGRLKPNSRETWLELQARALYQAWQIINSAYVAAKNNG